jgi:prevent-host-death family protein
MPIVNMHQAKTNLSRYVEAIESGTESEVVIARNGKPAARLVAVAGEARTPRKFGFAKGRFEFDYEAFQALDAEVEALFTAGRERKSQLYGD